MKLLKSTKAILLCGLMGFALVSCNSDNKEKVEESIEEVKVTSNKLVEDTKSMIDNANDQNVDAVFNETQVDSKAIFGDCSTAECSENKILSFIKENIVLPKNENLLDESLEQVLVVVDETGNIANVKFVASGNQKGCPACQQAAVDVVGKMKKWKPAMKDGNPVAVKMTIPVKFKNI